MFVRMQSSAIAIAAFGIAAPALAAHEFHESGARDSRADELHSEGPANDDRHVEEGSGGDGSSRDQERSAREDIFTAQPDYSDPLDRWTPAGDSSKSRGAATLYRPGPRAATGGVAAQRTRQDVRRVTTSRTKAGLAGPRGETARQASHVANGANRTTPDAADE